MYIVSLFDTSSSLTLENCLLMQSIRGEVRYKMEYQNTTSNPEKKTNSVFAGNNRQ